MGKVIDLESYRRAKERGFRYETAEEPEMLRLYPEMGSQSNWLQMCTDPPAPYGHAKESEEDKSL